jgi:hypothetical protein
MSNVCIADGFLADGGTELVYIHTHKYSFSLSLSPSHTHTHTHIHTSKSDLDGVGSFQAPMSTTANLGMTTLFFPHF